MHLSKKSHPRALIAAGLIIAASLMRHFSAAVRKRKATRQQPISIYEVVGALAIQYVVTITKFFCG
jgi:hypothetical protein